MNESRLLPIHGFVLAGGQSSRMGCDKALLSFCGRPMVQIAAETVRTFCSDVSIAGNRDDLQSYAEVVHETRNGIGPVAGIEAGLTGAQQPWAMFLPVDVPLAPAELLRRWSEAVLEKGDAGCAASFLLVEGERQPAFCMMRRACLATISSALDRGQHRIYGLLVAIGESDGQLWPADAELFAPPDTRPNVLRHWFSNLNTPDDAEEAEWLASHLP